MSDSDPLPNAETRVKALTAGELRGLAARDPHAQRIGPYVLQHRLGAGGMAEVFLAFNEGSDVEQQVVIKRILPHFAREPRYVEMFRREAAVSMGLDHPNIVRVFGLVEDRGQVGMVMEYLEGLTLFDLALRSWRANKSLPLEPLVQIFLESARALAFAHRHPDENGVHREIVHRDVSPDNLLVTKQGATKLLDFGVAKPEGEQAGLTRTGQIKGKVSYMAPEQVRGEKLDGRSDLFSLGTTFYWLLTGIRPFDRGNPVATMEAVVLADIPRPTELNPRIPSDLEIIVLRLLERDRRFRTPNGTDLERQLGQLLERVPAQNASPKWLLQEVLSLPEGPAMPRPEFPAVPTVDWHSGERSALLRKDPTVPNPLEGDWVGVDTAQFPVFGRLADPSSSFGEVFTESTLLAVEMPEHAPPGADEPVLVPDPAVHTQDPQFAATIPADGNDSAELADEARAVLQELEADPDTIRVPTSLPNAVADVRPPNPRLNPRRDLLGMRPTLQMPEQSAELSHELPPATPPGRATTPAPASPPAQGDLHERATLQMKSQADIDLQDPLRGAATLQMAASAEHSVDLSSLDADVHDSATLRLPSQEQLAHDPPTIPVPSGDTIPSHIETASGPTISSTEGGPVASTAGPPVAARTRPPVAHPDTLPDVGAAARLPVRAEDISVPSSPVVEAVSSGRRAGTLVGVLLVAIALAGAGAWFALSLAKPTATTTHTEVTDPKVTDPVVTDPVVTEPVVTDPVVTDPVVTDPKVTEPVVTDPKVTDPKATDPKATDPKATDPKATDPKVTEPKVTEPRRPAVAMMDIELRGTGAVSWKGPRGRRLGRGRRTASVPKTTTSVVAHDTRRGVKVTVPINGGVADYSAAKTEKLIVRARPWAIATLGNEKLGQTPFAPVAVAPGRYKITLDWEGKTTERTVKIDKGEGQKVIAIDMRSLP